MMTVNVLLRMGTRVQNYVMCVVCRGVVGLASPVLNSMVPIWASSGKVVARVTTLEDIALMETRPRE